MLTKFNILIILLPFLSVFISSILFLIFQIFNNKNYLFNLLVSFFIVLLIFLFTIYNISYKISEIEIFYLIFSYICSFYLFVCLVQSQISSLQLTILRMIYLYPNINKKEMLKKYNANKIFEERIKRLQSGGIIYKKKSSFFIKNNKIIIYLNFTKILRKVFNVNS